MISKVFTIIKKLRKRRKRKFEKESRKVLTQLNVCSTVLGTCALDSVFTSYVILTMILYSKAFSINTSPELTLFTWRGTAVLQSLEFSEFTRTKYDH